MQRNEKKLYIYIFLAKDIFPLEYLLDSYLQAIIFQSLPRREKRSTIVESKLYPGGMESVTRDCSNFCFVSSPRGSAIEVSGRVHRDN